jgi:phospholipid transport system substrate-binding protein
MVGTLACSPAFAASPSDHLRDFFTQVEAILADPSTEDRPLERIARVRRLVPELADIRSAAALALGSAWATKTAAERDEFVPLFADVLERAYVGRLAGAIRGAGGVTMTYGAEVVTGDEATVPTTLRGVGGRDVRIDFRMTRRSARWRVYDVEIDGVSTVENYRAQFARLLQRGSWSDLLAQLRGKLAEESVLFTKSDRATVAASPAPPPALVTPTERSVRDAWAAFEGVPTASPSDEPPAQSVATAPVATVSSPAPRAARAPVVPRKTPEVPPAASPPAVTPPAPIAEPGVIGSALGALLLGLAGAAGAAVLRYRHYRPRFTRADLVLPRFTLSRPRYRRG